MKNEYDFNHAVKNPYTPHMVTMSVKSRKEKLVKLEVYEKIAIAEDDLASGRTASADDVLNRLREKHEL